MAVTRGSDLEERRALLEKLRLYLEKHYGIKINSMNRLDRGVYRVDRIDGPAWVARAFPVEREVERVQGDADVLQFLEQNDFPAERCAAPNSVSAPGGRGVLVTKFIDGKLVEPNEPTLQTIGELLGRLNTLPSGSGGVAREAGSLHHYSTVEGGSRNELNAALSWLDEVEDQVTAENRTLHKTLREQVARIDDCNDLPKALIHPDPVLKNLIVTPEGPAFIDWTGAGQGPRLVSLALFIWSGALNNAGWSRQNVDAMVKGYRSYVQLQENELARLADAMRIRPYVFACWRYRHAIISGKPPDGNEWWWPSEGLIKAITERACAGFEKAGKD